MMSVSFLLKKLDFMRLALSKVFGVEVVLGLRVSWLVLNLEVSTSCKVVGPSISEVSESMARLKYVFSYFYWLAARRKSTQ